MTLSILCVTKRERHAIPFLTEFEELSEMLGAQYVQIVDGEDVQSRGYIESVLELALKRCQGMYVLRVDDDERCSYSMLEWLRDEEYVAAPHWKFPRAHLWNGRETFIANPPLWPDHQTRLSLRHMSGGRHTVHAGSPFGGGSLAPVFLEHHKFLVKTAEERRRIAQTYDAFQQGYGTGTMLPFNVPEAVWEPDQMDLRPLASAEWFAREDAERYART
jgi:hypothetical protein